MTLFPLIFRFNSFANSEILFIYFPEVLNNSAKLFGANIGSTPIQIRFPED